MKIDKNLIIAKLTLKKVIAFYNEHGKLPLRSSKDENEAKLGIWLHNRRSVKCGKGSGKWYPELETIAMNHGLSDLFEFNGKGFKQRAVDNIILVISFYNENGRLPTICSKNKYEKKLGAWLSSQRQAKKGTGTGTGKWYPELETIAIENGLPDLFDNVDLKQITIDNLMLVIAFYNEHGKLPSAKAKNEDDATLGRWISTQRSNKQGKGKWHPKLETIANDHGLPYLFDTNGEGFKQRTSDKQLMLVISFYKEHERLPTAGAKNKIEAKLGSWISTQRMAKKGKGTGKWYPELEIIAIKHGFPKLFENADLKQIAIDTLMLVIAFYKEHKRLPKSCSKDENEKKIGRWLSKRRSNKKRKCPEYPELETIAIEHGLPKLFETKKRKR
jgi:hypothetical protein